MIRRRILSFDTYVAKTIGRFSASTATFFRLTGLIIRPGFWMLVLLVIGVVLLAQGFSTIALFSFISAFCVPVSSLMKFVFRRERPVTIYTESMRIKSYSFPSSHSFAAAVGAVSCAVVAATFIGSAPLLIVLALVVAGVVGVSRIYVGAHYPSDVVGGIVAGCVVCLIVWLAVIS